MKTMNYHASINSILFEFFQWLKENKSINTSPVGFGPQKIWKPIED